MAIADAISDLFNCGRPRRPSTRDSAKPGENVTRMNDRVGATHHHGSAETPLNTSAYDNSATLLPVPEASPFQLEPLDSQAPIDTPAICASTETSAVRSVEEAEKVPQGRTTRDQGGDQRAKPGKVTQIEKRILVTTDAPDAGLATFDLCHEDVNTSAKEVTPATKASDSIRTSLLLDKDEPTSETIEEKAPDAASTMPVETHEMTPEVAEKLTAPRETTNTKLLNDRPAVPLAFSTTQPQEAEPVVMNPEAQIAEPQVPLRASIQFLDLPTEIRGLIYEQMTEENTIRMCRYDDPALARSEALPPKRQFYNLTQVCQQTRKEFLPLYEQRTEYMIDLWTQRANLTDITALKGSVAIDIDAACFDMQPIDLLPFIRFLARTRKTHCRFASTEGVIFRSIESIVEQLNKLLPSPTGSNNNWLAAVNGPMKRVDLHLFPHEDIRQYYRFRGAEPMLRVVYPARATEDWMKQSHKGGGEYESYLEKSGLDGLDMHVVIGHASRRTTNEGRMPLDWRLSYVGSRLSIDQAVRISGTWTR